MFSQTDKVEAKFINIWMFLDYDSFFIKYKKILLKFDLHYESVMDFLYKPLFIDFMCG